MDPSYRKKGLNGDSDEVDEPDVSAQVETDVSAEVEPGVSPQVEPDVSPEDETEASERHELQRAIDTANEATRLEKELETSLTPNTAPEPTTPLQHRLNTSYGRHVQRTAEHIWRRYIQSFSDEFRRVEEARGNERGDEAELQTVLFANTRMNLERRVFRPENVFELGHGE